MASQTWQNYPKVTWFYIPLGSRKPSKAFKFCFPSSALLGSEIILSKGFLGFTQAWEWLATFVQNSFFKVFLVFFLPGCVCSALARVCSSLMRTSHLCEAGLEWNLCCITLINGRRGVVGNFISAHGADYPSQAAALGTGLDPAALMHVCIKHCSPRW